MRQKLFLLILAISLFIRSSGQIVSSDSITNDNISKLNCSFSNNLIYLSLSLSNYDSLIFYTDTGGKNFLYKSAIRKLGVTNIKKNLWFKSNLEKIFIENSIPLPKLAEMNYYHEKGLQEDGMLGREWFADKAWRIDYKRKEFYKQQNISRNDSQLISPIFFLKDSTKNVMTYLPRIEVFIQGDTFSFLFDTGAQVYLSFNAQKEMNESYLIATSFISSSVFDNWKYSHPEWKIIYKGDKQYKEDMIRVPEIKIGNNAIGPVWFVKRDKRNFQVMSKFFMDEEIVGAIGGNALCQLGNITIDYKTEKLFINK